MTIAQRERALGGALAISAGLAMIGLVLPWQPYHEGTISGTLSMPEGDRLVVLGAAIATMLVGLTIVAVRRPSAGVRVHRILLFVALVMGVVCVLEAVRYSGLLSARSPGCNMDPGFDPRGCLASPGPGIYAVGIGGVGGALVAATALVASRRRRWPAVRR